MWYPVNWENGAKAQTITNSINSTFRTAHFSFTQNVYPAFQRQVWFLDDNQKPLKEYLAGCLGSNTVNIFDKPGI